MQIYILKKQFIEDACKLDKEFKTKIDRPYLCIVINHKGQAYLMPLSHSSKSKYSFIITGNKAILFDKCFPLVNKKIISNKYVARSDVDIKFLEVLKETEDIIYAAFLKYVKNHPTRWSVNNTLIIKLQKEKSY